FGFHSLPYTVFANTRNRAEHVEQNITGDRLTSVIDPEALPTIFVGVGSKLAPDGSFWIRWTPRPAPKDQLATGKHPGQQAERRTAQNPAFLYHRQEWPEVASLHPLHDHLVLGFPFVHPSLPLESSDLVAPGGQAHLVPNFCHRLLQIDTPFSCRLITRSPCPASASKARAFSSKYSCRS